MTVKKRKVGVDKMRLMLSVVLIFILTTSDSFAYVGPGLGLGVIGAIIGIVAAVFLAIVGVFWYPLKRMFKNQKPEKEKENEQNGDKENDT